MTRAYIAEQLDGLIGHDRDLTRAARSHKGIEFPRAQNCHAFVVDCCPSLLLRQTKLQHMVPPCRLGHDPAMRAEYRRHMAYRVLFPYHRTLLEDLRTLLGRLDTVIQKTRANLAGQAEDDLHEATPEEAQLRTQIQQLETTIAEHQDQLEKLLEGETDAGPPAEGDTEAKGEGEDREEALLAVLEALQKDRDTAQVRLTQLTAARQAAAESAKQDPEHLLQLRHHVCTVCCGQLSPKEVDIRRQAHLLGRQHQNVLRLRNLVGPLEAQLREAAARYGDRGQRVPPELRRQLLRPAGRPHHHRRPEPPDSYAAGEAGAPGPPVDGLGRMDKAVYLRERAAAFSRLGLAPTPLTLDPRGPVRRAPSWLQHRPGNTGDGFDPPATSMPPARFTPPPPPPPPRRIYAPGPPSDRHRDRDRGGGRPRGARPPPSARRAVPPRGREPYPPPSRGGPSHGRGRGRGRRGPPRY